MASAPLYIVDTLTSRFPLWVISVVLAAKLPLPVYPEQQTL